MGYACPVCEVPQRDGEHLANHLAFTAMLRGDAHEDWLDDNVPGWGDENPDSLADRVTDLAESAAYDEVFEDTAHDDHDDGERLDPAAQGADPTARGHDHGATGSHGSDDSARPNVAGRGYAGNVDDDDLESVMAEARELTREMYDDDGEAEDDTSGADSRADE
jgi:hypothetical protein